MSTNENFNKIWKDLNDAGKGFAVGGELDDINRLAKEIGGTLIHKAASDADVAAYETTEHYVVVGDSNGPWAVQYRKFGTSPSLDEVMSLRESIQSSKGFGITAAQDFCATLLYTSRRTWQQWERGERRMHPSFWELACVKAEKHQQDLSQE